MKPRVIASTTYKSKKSILLKPMFSSREREFILKKSSGRKIESDEILVSQDTTNVGQDDMTSHMVDYSKEVTLC